MPCRNSNELSRGMKKRFHFVSQRFSWFADFNPRPEAFAN
jgi:hypothetical protein